MRTNLIGDPSVFERGVRMIGIVADPPCPTMLQRNPSMGVYQTEDDKGFARASVEVQSAYNWIARRGRVEAVRHALNRPGIFGNCNQLAAAAV